MIRWMVAKSCACWQNSMNIPSSAVLQSCPRVTLPGDSDFATIHAAKWTPVPRQDSGLVFLVNNYDLAKFPSDGWMATGSG